MQLNNEFMIAERRAEKMRIVGINNDDTTPQCTWSFRLEKIAILMGAWEPFIQISNAEIKLFLICLSLLSRIVVIVCDV